MARAAAGITLTLTLTLTLSLKEDDAWPAQPQAALTTDPYYCP